MGIGLLSCPYAMRLSGWAGLPALAGATCLFCLSGKLIVAGFKKIPADMPQTYPALGTLLLEPIGLYFCWVWSRYGPSRCFVGS